LDLCCGRLSRPNAIALLGVCTIPQSLRAFIHQLDSLPDYPPLTPFCRFSHQPQESKFGFAAGFFCDTRYHPPNIKEPPMTPLPKKQLPIFILFGLALLTLSCNLAGSSTFINVFISDDGSAAQNSAGQAQITPAPLATLAPTPTLLPPEIISAAKAEEELLVNLYQRVRLAVVSIEVTTAQQEEDPSQPGVPTPFDAAGQGAGFVYDAAGHIVTNGHVIEDATGVEVIFADGTRLPATIIGTDPDSDLAVLKIETDPASLLPVEWASSENVQIGQRAIAIGNPFGLDGTLTVGTVSSLNRSLRSLNPVFRIPEIIQTDAAINPANSGGPLFNSDGQVIGVTNAIVPRQVGISERSFLGVGFAIPSSLARRVIPSLIENGFYAHPYIGISGDTITPEIAAAMNLDSTRGVLVVEVRPNSPASRANLRGGNQEFTNRNRSLTMIGGDVVIAIEDETVNDFEDLISFLGRRGVVGETVTVTVIRQGQEMQVELTLEARPDQNQLFRP
jgi:2-alkenal reductase